MRRPSARTARVAAVTVLAAASVAACGLTNTSTPSPASSAGPTGTPVTVGISLPLTGAFSADGQASLRGYRLWSADVNTHGGLLGRPVKLIVLNDHSDPKITQNNYVTLITQDHVSLTLAPFSSLLTVPAATAANRYHYAMTAGSATAPTVYNAKLPNLFSTSPAVANQLVPFTNWVKTLPAGTRPKTAAYVMVDDPFADPPVEQAQASLQAAGIQTLYDNSGQPGSSAKLLEPDPKTGEVPAADLAAAADKIVALHPQVVVIGSVDVPTVAAFINVFRQRGFNPQMLIATSGPDQGQAFLSAIGTTSNADGIMVPNGWYGGYPNPLSHVMVQEYIAKYGGTASDINADVAEAYSAGQVMADAVTNVGLSNAKIISFLHGLRQPLDTVQGPALWARYVAHQPSGQNVRAASFIFQWQPVGLFVQVLSLGGKPSRGIEHSKPAWTSG